MQVRVGINGMGRIGREVLRAVVDRGERTFEVVAVNEVAPLETVAHLLRYDSTYGRWHRWVEVGNGCFALRTTPCACCGSSTPRSPSGMSSASTSWSRAPDGSARVTPQGRKSAREHPRS